LSPAGTAAGASAADDPAVGAVADPFGDPPLLGGPVVTPVGADPLTAATPVPPTVLEQPARTASTVRRAATTIPLRRRVG